MSYLESIQNAYNPSPIRFREVGEKIGPRDILTTADGFQSPSVSVGWPMRPEWVLRVRTTDPHTEASFQAKEDREARYPKFEAWEVGR